MDRTFVFDSDQSTVHLLDRGNTQTDTIDLDRLLAEKVSESGTFLVKKVEATALGKLLHALPIPAFLLDHLNVICFANEASGDSSGLQGQLFTTIFPNPRHAEKIVAMLEKVLVARKPQFVEVLMELRGNKLWSRISMRTLRVGDEKYVLILTEDLTLQRKQILLQQKHEDILKRAHDELEKHVEERTAELLRSNELLRAEISERKKVQSRLELSGKIIESCNEAIICMDLQGNITRVNQSFCRITGLSINEVIGQNMRIFQWGRPYGEYYHKIWQSLIGSGAWRGEVWDRRKDGSLYPVLLSISMVRDSRNIVTHYVAIFSDITRIKQAQKNLQRLAHYDHLTRLPNRLLFHDRLQQAMILAQRQSKTVAIMLLDLDRFKNINDTLGHRFGDKVLIAVAERLKKCIRMSDTAARLGGDEFLLLLPASEANGALKVAANIMSEIAKPLIMEGREIFLSTSIGITMFPDDGDSVDRLLRNADTALHHAKEQGKNRFHFFSKDMNNHAKKRQKMEHLLRVALSSDQFLLHYQPMLDVRSGNIIGIEALLRWSHPVRGPVSAAQLIPLAEETGLIVPIGEWVLRTACEQNRQWQRMGLPQVRIAVNLSGRQLRQRNIAQHILDIVNNSGLDPTFLEIELTESVMMDDTDETVKFLAKLKEKGINISIDDFGTGYSSLSYLRKFPVDRLKIDQSFVKNVTLNPYDQALVKAIVAVAHSRKLKVLAEGVETAEQLRFLQSSHCDEVQGYFVGRPISPDRIVPALQENSESRRR
ncbi:MAG TPA: EAL domain-containing protein [Desulfomonilaceae bacterium]|nr:EAL domain-containing protein [Desulfomonilaceae bacterium]